MPTGKYERRIRPVAERVRARVQIAASGCWIWQGPILPNGYGTIGVGQRSKGTKRTVYVHRAAYEALIGPVPEGLDLDHLCRVRSCCNPAHLEPVTRSENTLRGEGPAKLGALNGSKPHCKWGHLFDDQNTRMRRAGGRACRQCERDRREKRAA